MSVLLEFSMFPTDVGESKSKYVSKIIDTVRNNCKNYKLTPMGTIIEMDSLTEALEIVDKAYKAVEPFSSRVYTSIKIDIQKNKSGRMTSKIESIEAKIGNVNK